MMDVLNMVVNVSNSSAPSTKGKDLGIFNNELFD